ncbi:MAG: hypothetical protein KC503_25110 [Myxococcales bacterium]|nr:hypothetical protein [Myxococcales bacterium]
MRRYSTHFSLSACLLFGLAVAGCKPIGDGSLGARCKTDDDCDKSQNLICPSHAFGHGVTSYCSIDPRLRANMAELPNLKQWATSSEGTSEFKVPGAPPDETPFGIEQLVGEPDVLACSFLPELWAPASQRAGVVTITLSYRTAVFATGIEIVEVENPGAVIKVEAVAAAGGDPFTVWEGDDPTRACPGIFRIPITQTTQLVDKLIVHVNTEIRHKNRPFLTDYVTLDAVGLYGIAPSSPDGGTDALDASPDVGPDASPDVGPDAPSADAGVDQSTSG